jgi:hypothetical protein
MTPSTGATTTSNEELRCPTCGARQPWVLACRRCKCDLSLVVAALRQRVAARRSCLSELSRGNLIEAQAAALRCWRIDPDEEAARLLSVAFLLEGRYRASLDVRAASDPPDA